MSGQEKHNSFTESGATFLLVGVVSAYFASRYPVGTIDRVGPGFFPLVLACILAGLGAALLAIGLRARSAEADEPPPITLRSFAVIIGTIIFFGVAITSVGIVITVPLTVIFASLAQEKIDWRMTGIVAATMMIFTLVVFKFGLGLRIPVFPGIG